MRAIVVIPSNREKSLLRWFNEWKKELQDYEIIVVEDSPTKNFRFKVRDGIYHYSWEEIDAELKEKSWIIPRKTDSIRSFGFLKAYSMKPDFIVTMDDDCYPDDKEFLQTHWNVLNKKYPKNWMQHFPGIRVRGFPKKLETASCVLNMGLWSNIPDLDGVTQLKNPTYRSIKQKINYPAPFGYFLPISGMNVSFRPEILPAYYFLLMGDQYGIHRFGDIWAGIFLKKICDHLGYVICGGYPYVWHDRASDPSVNEKRERTGIKFNEKLWKDIRNIQLEGVSFKECYLSLADHLPEYNKYWFTLKKAMRIWGELF